MAYKNAGLRNYLPEEIEAIRVAFDAYIDATELPILDEFSYQNNISSKLLDKQELFALKEKALNKKRCALEKKTLGGEYNPAMAIFSLKQVGWSDKVETKNTHSIETIQLVTLTADEYRQQQQASADEQD